MNRTKPTEPALHMSLVGRRSRTGLPALAESPADNAPVRLEEVVIDGRRYRLVPAEPAIAGTAKGGQALGEILTARELQIAALVAEGRVNKQIGAELKISEWTVSTHLRRIFAKLNVDTRAAMVSRCFDRLSPPRQR
jgi:DNA-binding CsgD family transcriptional regulator